MPFSLSQRAQMQSRFQTETFDLLVIGGGINGAGIARDAALRGYRVALLEQEDFGFGTSSRSSRLIHGGVRYLEHGHFGLVFESLSERARLAKLARHLVRPLPFVLPVYRDGRSLLTVNLGLWLYDLLALFRNHRIHTHLSGQGVLATFPGLRKHGLQGGVRYYDYQTDDARLVLENILSAATLGAAALSYTRVQHYERQNRHTWVTHAWDRLDNASFTVRSRVVVSAAGPWTDQLLGLHGDARPYLQPTKGVHIVLPYRTLPIDTALVMQHPKDARLLFALPHHNQTVLGTTDTPFAGDPATVATTAEDVHYLLDAAQHYFPEATLTFDDIIATWAGIRPLLRQGADDTPNAASREHRIDTRNDSLIIIAGGKLTTYRRMAAECVDVAARLIAGANGPAFSSHLTTRRVALPGAQGLRSDADLEQLADTLGQRLRNPSIGRHLAYTYGSRAEQIMQQQDADMSPIVEGLPYVWAEIAFAVCEEMALTLADVLVRRTQIFYRAPDQGLSVAEAVAALMAPYLGWDVREQERQVQAYQTLVAANRQWKVA